MHFASSLTSPMAIFCRSRNLIKTLNTDSIKSISTFTFLSQEPQLASELPPSPPPPPPEATPLPPNPASGSPLYGENWRNPIPASANQSLIPLGFLHQSSASRLQSLSQTLDAQSLLNLFADWITSQRWEDMKQMFEFWVRCLDKNGKPNKPDVSLYNQYLRANLMLKASAAELFDLIEAMEDFGIRANTASYNLVLKAMIRDREKTVAATDLLDRMNELGKESPEMLPDDESYDLVIEFLFDTNQIEAAFKYVNLNIESGCMLSLSAFKHCVQNCVFYGKVDTLVSIIERCKKMDQNKALCPPWKGCNQIVDIAVQADHSELAYYGLEFMAKWILKGDRARPPVHLSVDEALIVSVLGSAGRTYNIRLVEAAWQILKRSLRQKRVPSPEAYLAKICAYASMGKLDKAFRDLFEFESLHGSTTKEAGEDLFSPFSTLYPLAVACCKKGYDLLDHVYYELEKLSKADPPFKSVAALNCVLLGCANIWDVDRTYQTFAAISSTFGLTPDINSYNGLISVFGKRKKREEALKVFEHFKSVGVKPNAVTYALLVDAHLIAKDPRAALSIIDEMVISGFTPTKEILKKVRRRCIREMDYESDDQVESLAKKFDIRMGGENRRNMLFNLEFGDDY